MLREAAPPKFGELLTQHRNSERELATIERMTSGQFAGQYVLCFYDEDSPTVAPMLLDASTRAWLVAHLVMLVPDNAT